MNHGIPLMSSRRLRMKPRICCTSSSAIFRRRNPLPRRLLPRHSGTVTRAGDMVGTPQVVSRVGRAAAVRAAGGVAAGN